MNTPLPGFLKKILVFLATIAISICFASLFGIIHDQITYTICNEYYTKFKFHQFGLTGPSGEATLPHPRFAVAKVGLLATWWVGKYIGIVFGLTGLLFTDHRGMMNAILKALGYTFVITILAATTGFIYGNYFANADTVNWWLPDNLIHKKDFVTVGIIHNFSYSGGGLGLIFGIVYLLVKNNSEKKRLWRSREKTGLPVT